MKLRTWIAGLIAVLAFAAPNSSSAASATELQSQIDALLAQIAALQGGSGFAPSVFGSPAIGLTAPVKGQQTPRTDDMTISWQTKGINRAMVVEGTIKLLKADPEDVGAVGGGSFIVPIERGATAGKYVWSWGNNDSIPGTYSVSLRLRECNKRGCDIAPARGSVGEKTRAVEFVVTTDEEGGDEDGNEIISIDLEVNDSNEGAAPLPVTMTGRIKGQANKCPVVFPHAELQWGDGAISQYPLTQATSTASSSSWCSQVLTMAYSHTYTQPGDYIASFLIPTFGRDTVRMHVTGSNTQTPSATVDAKTYTTSLPVLTGTVQGAAELGISVDNGPTNYGSTNVRVANGSWSHQIGTALVEGSHLVQLYTLGASQQQIGSGRITVQTKTRESAPSCTITSTNSSIYAGNTITISWNSANASYGVMNGGDKLDTSGSLVFNPTKTTTYSLTVFGPTGGKAGCSTTVSVVERVPDPVVSFSAAPATISTGGSSTLSWSSTGANRCGLMYGATETSVSTRGSLRVTPAKTTMYTLWCTNDSGDGKDGPSARATATVYVLDPQKSIRNDITASALNAIKGQLADIFKQLEALR